jgi:hypothetical protein
MSDIKMCEVNNYYYRFIPSVLDSRVTVMLNRI